MTREGDREPTSITPELVAVIRDQFLLDWEGIHGANHWARVRANGLRLAALTGAHRKVVEYFAFLHDARRESDGHDPAHGVRAVHLAESLRGARLLELDDAEFALFDEACRFHSDGRTDADITVQTCWDADRLDLGRVGIKPDPKYLCTPAAQDRRTIRWAYARSVVRR